MGHNNTSFYSWELNQDGNNGDGGGSGGDGGTNDGDEDDDSGHDSESESEATEDTDYEQGGDAPKVVTPVATPAAPLHTTAMPTER